ncbi:MAG: GIY-YIG nuclease family protein [Patescibacteria group bacterium]
MDKTSDVLLVKRYYVYTLQSLKDSKFYTGYTIDLKKRLVEHASGLVISTRLRRPFRLIHYEYFINEPDAKARERFLKSGFGREQLKQSLKRTLTTS